MILQFIAFYGVISLLALFLAYRLSKSFADRIIHVALQMETIRSGRPRPLLLKNAGNDEIGILSGAYNFMTAEINELLNQKELAAKELQKAEFRALQAQINPHFLYNTLDVIKWMILDKNPDDSVWMVNALSRYLRMSINKGEAIVPLSDELDLTRTYLGIMQKRFSHQFEVEYDLDQAAMECLIPKLSLQPLVENALLHGILYCDKTERRLVIRAWRSSRAFGVEIEDNGNGMAPETAQKLTELDIRTSKSYGVANVHKRLDIFGQGKCKFYISAREGIGTCVMIELPVQPHDSD